MKLIENPVSVQDIYIIYNFDSIWTTKIAFHAKTDSELTEVYKRKIFFFSFWQNIYNMKIAAHFFYRKDNTIKPSFASECQ